MILVPLLFAACIVYIVAGASDVGESIQELADDEPALPWSSADYGQPEPSAGELGFGTAKEAQCEADGGKFGRAGLLGFYRCIRRYPDAGKLCTSARQCAGRCVSMEESFGFEIESQKDNLKPGQCEYDDNPFGCTVFLNNSGVWIKICAD